MSQRASAEARASARRSWFGCGPVALAVVGLVFLLGAFFFFRPDRSARERVEVEHSISLPPSARDIQTLGDASQSVMALVNLDRGASSIMVLDRGDVPLLLDSFGFVVGDAVDEQASDMDTCFGGASGPAPGNSIYQPDRVPWPANEQPADRYSTSEPPGSADVACVYLYELDDANSVGLWLYSDWN